MRYSARVVESTRQAAAAKLIRLMKLPLGVISQSCIANVVLVTRTSAAKARWFPLRTGKPGLDAPREVVGVMIAPNQPSGDDDGVRSASSKRASTLMYSPQSTALPPGTTGSTAMRAGSGLVVAKSIRPEVPVHAPHEHDMIAWRFGEPEAVRVIEQLGRPTDSSRRPSQS